MGRLVRGAVADRRLQRRVRVGGPTQLQEGERRGEMRGGTVGIGLDAALRVTQRILVPAVRERSRRAPMHLVARRPTGVLQRVRDAAHHLAKFVDRARKSGKVDDDRGSAAATPEGLTQLRRATGLNPLWVRDRSDRTDARHHRLQHLTKTDTGLVGAW